MAPKKKYETPDELRRVVYAYFDKCRNSGVFPDYAGMKIAIGIKSEETIKEYCKDPEFKEVFDEAKLGRESYLVRTMTSDNKRAQGCMNALKQPINGGYSDKMLDNGPQKIVIEWSGIGENAYK